MVAGDNLWSANKVQWQRVKQVLFGCQLRDKTQMTLMGKTLVWSLGPPKSMQHGPPWPTIPSRLPNRLLVAKCVRRRASWDYPALPHLRLQWHPDQGRTKSITAAKVAGNQCNAKKTWETCLRKVLPSKREGCIHNSNMPSGEKDQRLNFTKRMVLCWSVT